MKFLACPTDKVARPHLDRQRLPDATITAEGTSNTKLCWECILISTLKKNKLHG